MIEIYSKPDCVWCDRAKGVMITKNISYQEFVIGKDVTRSWVLEAFPMEKTLPIILENKRLIGGYTEFINELASNPDLGKTLLFG